MAISVSTAESMVRNLISTMLGVETKQIRRIEDLVCSNIGTKRFPVFSYEMAFIVESVGYKPRYKATLISNAMLVKIELLEV